MNLTKEQSFGKSMIRLFATVVVFFFSIVFCFLFLSFLLGILSFALGDAEQNYQYSYGNESSSNKLLAIDVSGIILGESTGGDDLLNMFSEEGIAYGYDIKEELREAANREDIKGVVLEINSPGGTIFGSRAIADGVAYYRSTTGKPVYAFIKGLAASGGYWSASSADYIAADYGSSIGSIGVIYGPFKYYDNVISEDGGIFLGGVVTQNGIDTTYFTAGKYKDLGNPYRQLTNEEVTLIQRTVNNEYDNFVEYISTQRDISQTTIRNQIGAMIYDNKSAKELGLIDDTNTRENIYHLLAAQLKLAEDDFQVVESIGHEGTLEQLLSALYSKNSPMTTQSYSFCPITRNILAYYGNVASLCE